MIDKYRLIAVVDSARSISQSEVSPTNLFGPLLVNFASTFFSAYSPIPKSERYAT